MDQDVGFSWVRGALRSHMSRLGFTYASLTRALRDTFELEGEEWNERNIANKVGRGHFSAVFFVQCLEAMGVKELKLDMSAHVVTRRDVRPEVVDPSAAARERAKTRKRRNAR
ncbi:MAG TPA: DUF6471 domain-containing protein [Caulobacteraceae bacterium]|jgi:hypothetical protein|nr:DUF6471 domain-containing protein [Caulobacteraceae bacterium]